MKTDIKTVNSFTRTQAKNWIMEAPAGTMFYVWVALDVRFQTSNPDHLISEPRKVSLKVKKMQALEMVVDLMAPLDGHGAKIDCMTHVDPSIDYVAYWIGLNL